MRPGFLLVCFLICGCSVPASGARSALALGCQEVEIPIESAFLTSTDTYQAPNVSGRQQIVRFAKGTNPLLEPKFVKIEPLASTALLDDGSVLQFIRDVNGDGHVMSVRTINRASCLTGIYMNAGYQQNGPHEIILAEYEPGRGRELLRLENYNGHGRISRVVQLPEKPFGENEEVFLLLESKHPFHGFGVSVPSIHGGWRSLMTITQNEDGSLIVGSYAYAIRDVGLHSRPFP